MTGHEVRKQTNGERERRHDDGRDELDDADERLQRCRDARRPQQVTEVGRALILQTDADECDPDSERQHERAGEETGFQIKVTNGGSGLGSQSQTSHERA